jgi:aspartyl-tRNA(Asn)/glutamyl-tRNA(Gln) amidotransferase subunit A
MYLADIFTVASSLAGICGVNVPCGFDDKNLPIGLQLLGPQFGESTVLRAGYQYQQVTEFHTRKPKP